MPSFKPGSRWRSAVCATQIVVIRAPAADLELRCGGRPMVPLDDPAHVDEQSLGELGDGTRLGKRYVDDKRGLEVLCTQPGAGALAVQGVALPMKEARALPSSD